MPGPNMITPAQLMRLIGTPDAPVIVDVRITEDIAPDELTLPAAIFHAFTEPDGLQTRLNGRKAVIICYKGLKLSQGMAALIRANGGQAEVLEGGYCAWHAAKLPLQPITDTSRWVTRHKPKIDRIACPWLIRRFIDPDAQFMFVPPSDVSAVADRFDAIAFDVPDAVYGHQGDRCTFDALLDGFGLHTQALDRLATVVRAADTDKHSIAPQAAGLLAISVGLSKLHRDDNAMLDAGMSVYDALYRWARDGFDEGHSE